MTALSLSVKTPIIAPATSTRAATKPEPTKYLTRPMTATEMAQARAKLRATTERARIGGAVQNALEGVESEPYEPLPTHPPGMSQRRWDELQATIAKRHAHRSARAKSSRAREAEIMASQPGQPKPKSAVPKYLIADTKEELDKMDGYEQAAAIISFSNQQQAEFEAAQAKSQENLRQIRMRMDARAAERAQRAAMQNR